MWCQGITSSSFSQIWRHSALRARQLSKSMWVPTTIPTPSCSRFHFVAFVFVRLATFAFTAYVNMHVCVCACLFVLNLWRVQILEQTLLMECKRTDLHLHTHTRTHWPVKEMEMHEPTHTHSHCGGPSVYVCVCVPFSLYAAICMHCSVANKEMFRSLCCGHLTWLATYGKFIWSAPSPLSPSPSASVDATVNHLITVHHVLCVFTYAKKKGKKRQRVCSASTFWWLIAYPIANNACINTHTHTHRYAHTCMYVCYSLWNG